MYESDLLTDRGQVQQLILLLSPVVFKLRLKYKVDVMVQRVIILLLVMVVILVGCSEEDDLGGVAKVSGTLPPIGSQIDLVRSISI